MLELNTSDFGLQVEVKIDGHPYRVRRLGAGEELKLGSLLRKMRKLLREMAKPEVSDQRTDQIEKEVDDLEQESIRVIALTFNDGGDGSKSLDLISRLSHEDRTTMIRKIFAGVPSETENPEDIEDAGEDTTDSSSESESN